MEHNNGNEIERRCEDCKDWSKTCFSCRFEDVRLDQNVPFDDSKLRQISGLEFLNNNPITVREPQLDFTFRERQRRPQMPRNNEPLAMAIMHFADDFPPNMALEMYLDALLHHSSLNDLNIRVIGSLIVLGRDAEAISFIESLIQWPTMPFTKNIWLFCRDSCYDEIRGVEELDTSMLLLLGLIKARAVSGLKSETQKLQLVLETEEGSHLTQVETVVSDYLGRSVLVDQERQLGMICSLYCDNMNEEMPSSQARLLEGEEIFGAMTGYIILLEPWQTLHAHILNAYRRTQEEE